MAVLKCKMCGGDLYFEEGASTCVCDYCGNTNTLPVTSSDREMNLFNRANHFRMINEFDKAISAYEKILDADDTNAEAHWGIVLSRYGIEYVEDPVSHERIPTCHRVQMTGILSDPDYLAAVEHADFLAASEYKAQAERIAEIQKGILAISSREKPYDVFICYKETDENGRRTVDSTLAQDIYFGLTEAGYRVFFSRITLEDKLGQEYEPYIFAALNSAKVMVTVGTKPEHFNAVWVKNEWSRYLDLMKNDRHRLLIPCYRDMDPYDLPDELSMLQSQDMSKIGFMQDLLRGIKKVLGSETEKSAVRETAAEQQVTSGTSASAQVKRGNMALEDQDWKKADDFFEEALNHDPECAEAYLGKLLAQEKKKSWEELIGGWVSKYESVSTERLTACDPDTEHIEEIIEKNVVPGYLDDHAIRQMYMFDLGYDSSLSCRKQQKDNQLQELSSVRHLQRAKQYAKGQTKSRIEEGLGKVSKKLDQRIATAQQEDTADIDKIRKNYTVFLEETDLKISEMNKEAQERREQDYRAAVDEMKSAGILSVYEETVRKLSKVGEYKDSQNLIAECRREIDRLNEERKREEERQAEIRRQEIARAEKKKKTITGIVIGLLAACVAGYFVVTRVIIPNNNYKAAVALMESGDYEGAITAFEKLGDHKDSKEQIEACETAIRDKKYDEAVALKDSGDYVPAYLAFEEMDGYKDSEELKNSIKSEYKSGLLAAAEVGSVVVFGTYEQDNDKTNGKEDIEWIVLDKQDDRLLVISQNGIDCKEYHDHYSSITWESCTLREWLNSIFLTEAFEEKERAMISREWVKAEDNEKYITRAGNDTEDKIFLLSISEAKKYFSSDDERQCKPTAYAEAQGAEGWWWLRSPGFRSNCAADVSSDGSVNYGGLLVGGSSGCVRPALWINLES